MGEQAPEAPTSPGCTRTHGRAGARGADQPPDAWASKHRKVLTSLGEQALKAPTSPFDVSDNQYTKKS